MLQYPKDWSRRAEEQWQAHRLGPHLQSNLVLSSLHSFAAIVTLLILHL